MKLYDERFFRMWEFYLAGGIVMFESGAACNYQVQYIRDRRTVADYPRLHGGSGGTLSRGGWLSRQGQASEDGKHAASRTGKIKGARRNRRAPMPSL